MVICFRTSYYLDDGREERGAGHCAWKYFTGYFILDFTSCIPGYPLSSILPGDSEMGLW